MKKKIITILVGISMIILSCGAIIVHQNTFHMRVVPVQIPTTKGELKGQLVLPKESRELAGLVVFIHGDGPVNASYHGDYEPLWEELAKLGYASLSWNKPGVEGATGNWLLQTMDDRAAEAVEVIDWARANKEIGTEKIGLWGASQAGWVIPKIIRRDKEIAFSILVAPAINWIDQGWYNTLAKMQQEGKTRKEQEQAKEDFLWTLEMLKKHASYQEYHGGEKADQSLSEERWNFILKNYQADATEDLRFFYSPVKLFLGGKDINVDSNNTKEVYEQEIPQNILSVTLISGTDHFMLRDSIVDSKMRTTLTALFAPRQLAHPQYYAGIKEFLQSVEKKE